MRRVSRFLGVALAAVASVAHAQDAAPRRIASINLCTDQHLIAMADAAQIVGLSPYARDPARAWFWKEAARFPLLSGGAEDVLALKPDLVVAGRFTKRATRDLLREMGVRVEEFDDVATIDEVKAQILSFGALIGQPERGARQVADIDAAVARARAVALRRPLRALPLERRGWVSGEKSLMTSIIETVGLRNAAAGVAAPWGGLMSLERIVALDPDILVVSRDGRAAEDQGSAMLLHPALAARYPRERRIVVPENLTACGGAMLVEALDILAAQISRLAP